ncbi:MAG: MBL fold metallo-hydrolase [Gammaproteobacteria bacterium]|nr:MBL fold metallo-hydrolase [Gammaproteobacteria bacterium]
MRFASLGSGSRGNATVLEAGDSLLLVDCGFSVRETDARLARLGITARALSAILVTHEHTDHCSGVARLSRRYQLPVYMSHGTFASGRCSDVHEVRYFRSEAGFTVGEIEVMPVAVPHDAREPCQFVFRHGSCQLGVLTDLGSITTLVSRHYEGCQALLLECNHDPDMLREGPYPEALKRRVGGDWGHLSNAQAAEFLDRVQGSQLQHVVIAHISEKNNNKASVVQALETVYSRCADLCWADQQAGFDWLELF